MKGYFSRVKRSVLLAGIGMCIALPGITYAEDYAEIAEEVIPAYFASEKGKCLPVLVENLGEAGSLPRDMPYTVFFEKSERHQNLSFMDKLTEKGLFTRTEGTYGSMPGYFYEYTDEGKKFIMPGDDTANQLCVGEAILKSIDRVADQPKRSFGKESVPVDITVDYVLVKPFSDPDVKEIKFRKRSPVAKYDGKTNIKQKGKILENRDGDWVYEKEVNPLDPSFFL